MDRKFQKIDTWFDDFRKGHQSRPPYNTDKGRDIPSSDWAPHYSNSRFARAQTIFLADGCVLQRRFGVEAVDGASYDYSDRIAGWFDADKEEAAKEAAKASGFPARSAGYIESWLRALYEKPGLTIVHILAGVNMGNGYPYRVYGYVVNESEQ